MKNKSINDLNKDLSLDNIDVKWGGYYLLLLKNGKLAGTVTLDENSAKKIEKFCIKNTYRCKQINGGQLIF